jgi:hypothetical protein
MPCAPPAVPTTHRRVLQGSTKHMLKTILANLDADA